MKKFVVYSVITGEYESVLQPEVIDDRFDYVLFTDNVKSSKEGVWNIRSIPTSLNIDKIRLSRYPKTHPVNLLSDYLASLYIDANIQIKDNWIYSRFIEFVENKVEYAGVKLVITGRDCIYDHVFDMCVLNVEHDYNGIKQCHELFARKFPPHFGLNENGLIFRMHTDLIEKVDKEWWFWITNYSRRDQFSFMYCLWKYNVPINYIFPEGEDVRNSCHFNFVSHSNNPFVLKRKLVHKGMCEKVRLKALAIDKNHGLSLWKKSYTSDNPLITYYFLSIIAVFKASPALLILFIKKLSRYYN